MRIRLFNKYQAMSPEGAALADEIALAIEPIVEKAALNSHLREIESIVLTSAGSLLAEKIIRNALAMHDAEVLAEIEEAAK